MFHRLSARGPLQVSICARPWLSNSQFFNSLSFFLAISIALTIPLFQTQNINALYDISYMITNWYRIAEGQIPYRDFILVHNPGSFILGGLLFKVFGNSYYVVLSWMCFVNLTSLLLLRKILNKLKISEIQYSTVTLLLSFVLPYSISALPNYDGDSTFAVLICLFLFIHLISTKSTNWLAWFSFGVVGVLPFTIKQNIGVAFVISIILALCAGRYFRQVSQFIGGIAFTLVILATTMSFLGMLENWWNYSIVFAAQSRLGDPLIHLKILPGQPQFVSLVLAVLSTFFLYTRTFSSLTSRRVITLMFLVFTSKALFHLTVDVASYLRRIPDISSVAQVVSTSWSLYVSSIFLLFWIPWFFGLVTSWSAVQRLIYARPAEDELIFMSLNLVLMLCLYSALLSQGVIGSTYSNGSFLVLLVISSLKLVGSSRFTKLDIQGLQDARLNQSLIVAAKLNYSIFLLVLTFVYGVAGVSGGRLAFVNSDGERKSNAQISWLKTPGEYLPDQKFAEEIIRKYSKNKTVVVFIPIAEFAYVLAGTPPLADVHQFDPTVNPYLGDLDRFLNCNLVNVVVFNSRNQIYAYPWIKIEDWPPTLLSYELLEEVGPFNVLSLRKGELLEPDKYECPSTSYSKRLERD
jgi:hypothetical protein